MKSGLSSTQLNERCLSMKLNDVVSERLVNTWNTNSVQIKSSLLAHTISTNRLLDIDWNFGVTFGSSDDQNVGKTYLQLKLVIDEGINGVRTHFIELSIDQFYQLLATLESCKEYLDFFGSTIST